MLDKNEEKATQLEMYKEAVSENDICVSNCIMDEEFIPKTPMKGSKYPNRVRTRSEPTIPPGFSTDYALSGFPDVPIRTGRRTINEKLMRCTVHCLSKYKVSRNDLSGLFVDFANMMFDQKWALSSTLHNSEYSDSEIESEDECHNVNGIPPTPNTSKTRMRQKSAKDLSHIFPSNRCIDRYLEDASYLNLKMAAELILNKDDEDVITVG